MSSPVLCRFGLFWSISHFKSSRNISYRQNENLLHDLVLRKCQRLTLFSVTDWWKPTVHMMAAQNQNPETMVRLGPDLFYGQDKEDSFSVWICPLIFYTLVFIGEQKCVVKDGIRAAERDDGVNHTVITLTQFVSWQKNIHRELMCICSADVSAINNIFTCVTHFSAVVRWWKST